MRGVIRWRVPERAVVAMRPRMMRDAWVMFGRCAGFGVGGGAVVLGVVQWWMPDLMEPTHWWIGWLLLAGYAVLLLSFPLTTWLEWYRGSQHQGVTLGGLRLRDSVRWDRLVAHEVHACADAPDVTAVMLHSKSGNRYTLLLPDDERMQGMILKLIARHVPTVDTVGRDALTEPRRETPGLLKTVMVGVSIVYGAGIAPWYAGAMERHDGSELWMLLAAIFGPALWIAAVWSRLHRRTQAWDWALGCCILTLTLATGLALALRAT